MFIIVTWYVDSPFKFIELTPFNLVIIFSNCLLLKDDS